MMRSKIILGLLRTVLLVFLLVLSAIPLRNPYPRSIETLDGYPFGRGNAPEPIRTEILHQLAEFQRGYSERELEQVEEFTEGLLSRDNVLTLGTMPQEILIGSSAAERLIRADWASWGDCRFYVDGAHVSTGGTVAWIATVGFVRFDLSRFLVLPLRLTGVLVNEDGVWRFQLLQYQFDLDLTPYLPLVLLLLLLSTASFLAMLAQVACGLVRGRRRRTQLA